MDTSSSALGQESQDLYARISASLSERGYCLLPSWLPAGLIDALFIHFTSLDEQDFKEAAIGRESNQLVNPFIRGDRIHWLDRTHPVTRDYLDWMENLRLELNKRLFLGLFDYECQYAWYPPGAFYKKHLDAFQGNTNRILSTVLYLNPDWQPQDGGELLLYPPAGDDPIETVSPQYGRMAIFLSNEFPHEVAKTNKARRSIAGWFRVNNSLGTVDPPR
ncbi:MAG TPA: 2OG-Fe(II) oxygenase [Gammaproteobacteria bacterium]